MKSRVYCRRIKRWLVLVFLFALFSGVYIFRLNVSKQITPVVRAISENLALSCIHPDLILWHPDFANLFTKVKPLQCDDDNDWIFINNGIFHVDKEAILKHGNITCNVASIERESSSDTDIKVSRSSKILDGDKIPSDFIEVKCFGQKSQRIYNNIHASIAYSEECQNRPVRLSKNALGYNILIFGFDSVSRMTWQRNLPKTHDYFINQLGAVLLEGYNIVGDGTPQALLPILTGKNETELPEARRGKSGAKTVDAHPWIWRDLKDKGYITQWGEDGASYGTFTYRMLGFKDPPVDHYMRPFILHSERHYHKLFKQYCLGSKPRHIVMLEWGQHLFQMYPNVPKFSFIFHSEYSHSGHSMLQVADIDVVNFLRDLNSSGKLENTAVFLMADHGARFQAVRRTVQGKLEERLPYFSILMPKSFKQRYPTAMENLRINSKRLTTPFDIYPTLQDFINFRGGGMGSVSSRGISLFDVIPADRTCKDAHIEPHWCACLDWKSTSPDDPAVKQAAQAFVDVVNQMTMSERHFCAHLEVYKVMSASIFITNENVLKFKQSKDTDGRQADLSDKMQATEFLYQLRVQLRPGGGEFETTIKYINNQFNVNEREISRINKYGSHPHCVADRLPHLRSYCFCKIQETNVAEFNSTDQEKFVTT